MSQLKPFFTFYGGKWRAAPKYPTPTYTTIVEPFAGSAGYSLRYADRDIVLVEKDPIVAATWRYLIGVSSDEILSLPLLERGQSVDAFSLTPDQRRLIEGEYADAPDVEATWFVDPPYIDAGKYYRCGSRDLDFTSLGEYCRRLRGQVMVCENVGATWLPFQPYIDIKGNQSGSGLRTSREALWENTQGGATGAKFLAHQKAL